MCKLRLIPFKRCIKKYMLRCRWYPFFTTDDMADLKVFDLLLLGSISNSACRTSVADARLPGYFEAPLIFQGYKSNNKHVCFLLIPLHALNTNLIFLIVDTVQNPHELLLRYSSKDLHLKLNPVREAFGRYCLAHQAQFEPCLYLQFEECKSLYFFWQISNRRALSAIHLRVNFPLD